MANDKNLIPFNERTEEERRELGRKAGIASGEARRRKKTMKEYCEYFLEKGIKVSNPDGSSEDSTLGGAVVLAQIRKAVNGDTRAAYFVANLKGEMIEKHDFGDNPPLVILSAAENEKLKNNDK